MNRELEIPEILPQKIKQVLKAVLTTKQQLRMLEKSIKSQKEKDCLLIHILCNYLIAVGENVSRKLASKKEKQYTILVIRQGTSKGIPLPKNAVISQEKIKDPRLSQEKTKRF